MPFYRMGDSLVHMRMTNTRTRRAPAQCRAPFTWPGGQVGKCCAISTRLCDAPVNDHTCDMPLCPEHATSIGPDLDYCPKHAAERMNLGPCPYKECAKPIFVHVPREVPRYAQLFCEHCKRGVWYRLSRVDPQAWTDEAFQAEFIVDEAAGKITIRHSPDHA